jgi:choline dehydrogenase-like flavoprotein
VSYVPAALGRGASLATGVRVTGLLPDGGVTGRTTGTGVEVTVRARATVLACGTLLTPLILQRAGVKLRHLGRNLTIHPATTVSGVFDEEVRGFAAVPQGWCVDELTPDGILLLGAGTPIEFGAAQLPVVGAELMDVMDAYDRVASFGVMVSDNPNGAVRAGPRGRPLVAYRLGARECALLHKGTVAVARIFFAAGARRVYAPVRGHRRLLDEADLSRFQGASVAVSDWMTLAAFHPLGTCRMSAWPDEGVVDLDNRVHGMDEVFVADGSVVPSSPRVNPQVTIMAFASRAAERIAAHL